MSDLREVNDITVIIEDGNETYIFPTAFCIAVPSGDFYDRSYRFGFTRSKRINFTDIVDNYGTTNIIEYLDYLAQNTNFYRFPTSGGGGGPSTDVNIIGSDPQLNLEDTQVEVRDTLLNIEQLLIDLACSIGWCYIFTKEVFIKAGKQYIVNEELILESGASMVIELGGKLFIDL